MAEDAGRLETDPLFLALTRPVMIAGVTYLWVAAEAFVFCLYFINTSDFGAIKWILVFHFFGMWLCSYEPRFMDIMRIGSVTASKCVNKRYHNNAASYDVY